MRKCSNSLFLGAWIASVSLLVGCSFSEDPQDKATPNIEQHSTPTINTPIVPPPSADAKEKAKLDLSSLAQSDGNPLCDKINWKPANQLFARYGTKPEKTEVDAPSELWAQYHPQYWDPVPDINSAAMQVRCWNRYTSEANANYSIGATLVTIEAYEDPTHPQIVYDNRWVDQNKFSPDEEWVTDDGTQIKILRTGFIDTVLAITDHYLVIFGETSTTGNSDEPTSNDPTASQTENTYVEMAEELATALEER